jgi:hypothetical protein
MPIYLVLLVIKGRSFLEGLRQAPKPYSKKGALLYCVAKPVSWIHFTGFRVYQVLARLELEIRWQTAIR